MTLGVTGRVLWLSGIKSVGELLLWLGHWLLGALGGRKMRSFLCISILVLETSFLRLVGWDSRLSGVGLEASVQFPRSVG